MRSAPRRAPPGHRFLALLGTCWSCSRCLVGGAFIPALPLSLHNAGGGAGLAPDQTSRQQPIIPMTAWSHSRRSSVSLEAKKKRHKGLEDFVEEEKEEGVWPANNFHIPQPWEADLGALDPFLFDPEDMDDDDEDFFGQALAGREEELLEGEDEEEADEPMTVEDDRPMTMDLPPSMEEEEEDSFDGLLMERALRFYEHYDGSREKEKCFLVGVEAKSRRSSRSALKRKQKARNSAFSNLRGEDEESEVEEAFTVEESLTELSELVGTAGLEVMGSTYQRLLDFNSRTCIGSGKVKMIKNMMASLGCRTVIIDHELTPTQQMNLETSFGGEKAGIKVLDRTALILDIFAQHAKTKEGKLQVELALNMYRLPRLTRLWTHLERQSSGGATGSVGLRGPGESQLEADKREIRKKIAMLKKELLQVHRHRSLHRVRREKNGYPVIALVGYTNSGKSTLLNTLTRAGAFAEDLMFATLDPTTRKLSLPSFAGSFPDLLMTDTVGFIQKLPTHLVAAFRATLEEIYMADILVHVVDASNPLWKKQKKSVDETLEDMGVADKPTIVLYNKVDLLTDQEDVLEEVRGQELSVAGSAVTGEGLANLMISLHEALRLIMVRIEAVIPYSNGDLLSQVHDRGSTDKVVYQAEGTYVMARVPQDLASRLLPYRVDEGGQSYRKKEEGAEVDWAALAKGRHQYMKKLNEVQVPL